MIRPQLDPRNFLLDMALARSDRRRAHRKPIMCLLPISLDVYLEIQFFMRARVTDMRNLIQSGIR